VIVAAGAFLFSKRCIEHDTLLLRPCSRYSIGRARNKHEDVIHAVYAFNSVGVDGHKTCLELHLMASI
jgi:hypothetical protein